MQYINQQKVNKLLNKISNGDATALEKLFRYTYNNLFTIVEFYIIDKASVKDVLSQLYSSIIEACRSFNENLNGYNWLCTIAINMAHKFNKESAKYTALDQEIPDYQSDDILKKIIVAEAVNSLEDKEKDLIYRLYWCGYTINEISAADGVSMSTLYSRKKSTLKKLRKFLN